MRRLLSLCREAPAKCIMGSQFCLGPNSCGSYQTWGRLSGRAERPKSQSSVPTFCRVLWASGIMFSKSGSNLSAVSQTQKIWRGRTELNLDQSSRTLLGNAARSPIKPDDYLCSQSARVSGGQFDSRYPQGIPVKDAPNSDRLQKVRRRCHCVYHQSRSRKLICVVCQE